MEAKENSFYRVFFDSILVQLYWISFLNLHQRSGNLMSFYRIITSDAATGRFVHHRDVLLSRWRTRERKPLPRLSSSAILHVEYRVIIKIRNVIGAVFTREEKSYLKIGSEGKISHLTKTVVLSYSAVDADDDNDKVFAPRGNFCCATIDPIFRPPRKLDWVPREW